jgi:hypothetical protein
MKSRRSHGVFFEAISTARFTSRHFQNASRTEMAETFSARRLYLFGHESFGGSAKRPTSYVPVEPTDAQRAAPAAEMSSTAVSAASMTTAGVSASTAAGVCL